MNDPRFPWNVALFAKVPIALFVQPLRATQRCVYVALCWRWWRTRDLPCVGITIGSLRDIAKEAGVSVAETMKSMEVLEDLGWIRRVKISSHTIAYVARPIPQQALVLAQQVMLNVPDKARRLTAAEIVEIRDAADKE